MSFVSGVSAEDVKGVPVFGRSVEYCQKAVCKEKSLLENKKRRFLCCMASADLSAHLEGKRMDMSL